MAESFTARFSTSVMPVGTAMTMRGRRWKTALVAHLVDERFQHRLGDFEIGDDAILHWADRDDVAGCATQHPLGFVAHGEDALGAGLDCDHGRFAQDDAAIADVDERVGGAEINADVVGKKTGENIHGKLIERKKGREVVREIEMKW